jgi:propane 2-monooxygenase small subunit
MARADGTALALSGDPLPALAAPGARRLHLEEAEAAARITAAVDQLTVGPAPADGAWLAFLREHMQCAAFVFHAAAAVLDDVAARCTWPALAPLLALEAGTQQRQAQALVLYVMDLERHFGPAPIDEARERWLTASAWQPARSFLAQLREVEDWGEALVAFNLCFEPLVGQLLRGELGTAMALVHGDRTTPVVAAAGQAEGRWTRSWMVELSAALTADPRHGDANRRLLEGWLARWLPPGLEAVYGTAELAADVPGRPDVDGALERVLAEHRALLASACLELVP